MNNDSLLDDLIAISQAYRLPDQPISVLEEASSRCRSKFGFKLLTFMTYQRNTGELQRIYSTNVHQFPIGVRKKMGPTNWGENVLGKGNTWLGNTAEEIHKTFPDAKIIIEFAGEACACLPIRWNSQTVGVLSLCDERDSYSFRDLLDLDLFAQLLLPAALGNCSRISRHQT